MMWPFSRKSTSVVGVQGQPLNIARKAEVAGPWERHAAVIGRIEQALNKERRGRQRKARLESLEAELFRHKALLKIARGK